MTKKIAIYNSFPCHYEMFGYIMFYCYVKKYTVDVFTETKYDMGWFSFYQNFFNQNATNYISFHDYHLFENNDTRNKYELIFVTTDDDPEFKHEWMNKKVVCINHYYICRRIDYYHCLAVRPFVENKIKWALPCIPVLNKSNKIVDPEIVHVCIIGGGNLDSNLYNLHVINRLKCTNKKIVLHVITRVITPVMLDILQKKNVDIAEIKLYNQFDTNNMFMLLQYCNYIFIDVTINNDHNIGYSMSGSTPIAFSSLSRLIISKQNNKLYKFSSALEFDSTTNDDIFIGDITVDIYELILQERDYLIKMFHNNVDEIIQKNQTMNHDGIYNYLIQNRNIV